jgi:phosphatidylserine/phosphatidylglycerophosphate/cardiolipin synthase-like enzyme
VLLELIRSAVRRLTIVSFAAYRVTDVQAALADAARRGVDVRLVLESAEEAEGRLRQDAADAFASLGRSVAFYVWPRERRAVAGGNIGLRRAKAVITDECAAFATSANLTGNALSTNMELGLLVRGGTVPVRLNRHFDQLISRGVLRKVN